MVIHPQQPVLPTTMSDAKPSLKIFEGTSLDNGPSKTTPMMSLRYGRSKKSAEPFIAFTVTGKILI